MIDLHMHTTYSDGVLSVRKLIEKLNLEGIKIASITDHNNIDGFLEYQNNGYDRLYNGIMIPGTELQTIAQNYVIEILVYSYVREFREYVEETKRNFWNFHHKSYKELIERAKEIGLKVSEPPKEIQNGYYCNMKFQDALKHEFEYNRKIVDERIINDLTYFYRNEYQNPNSKFFIDNRKAFPMVKDLIDAAHYYQGITSLAHIDDYLSIEDKDVFLEYLFSSFPIDAIECFHPTISDEHTIKYMNFAHSKNILISAGSDFHGGAVPHRGTIDTKATKKEVTILEKILKCN